MTLSDLSIRRPVFAWMIMAASVVFGLISFSRLGVSRLPDVTQPILTINVSWPGAAPEVMEADVVNPLEEAVMSVQGIKNMESTIMQGMARIKLEFYLDRDIDAALQETNSRVRSVALPEQADVPTISKVNQDSAPILWMGVTWDRSFHDLVAYVDTHLKDRFLVVPGVGDIQLGGWADRTMRIWVDNDKLAKYQLTILDVRDTLKADYNEVASGIIENNRQEMNVRTMGETRSPEDIAKLVISRRGGAPIIDSTIHIGDVATVEDGLADIRRFSRADGQASIGLGIRKQRGYNDVQVAADVQKVAEELSKNLPPGMKLATRFDTTTFTRDAIHETEFTLLMSILITGFVCWAFLGSWRSTLNVLFSIPTSILGAFVVLYFFGFTLNFFTLLGLSLAIGIVVDDAIMVLENIVRHFQMGKDRVQASLDGAREITFAAVAATVSVVAIFSPVFFVGGMVGSFLYQFGVTISAAVLISLLEAITLTPMRCSQFMDEPEHESFVTRWVGRQFGRLARGYRKVLAICLRHRWKVVLTSLFLFLLSLSIFPLLSKELSPPQDTGAIMLQIRSKTGSSLDRTADLLKQVENYLGTLPYIKKTFSNVGGYGGGEVTTGNIFVTLVDRHKRKLSQQQIIPQMRQELQKIKGLRIQVIDLSLGMFSTKRGTAIELSLRGPDYAVLRDKSREIINRMEKAGEFTDMDTDYREGVQELRVIPDRDKAAQSNVSVQTIADTLNAAIGGIRVGKYTNEDRRYDVRIRLKPEQWQTPADVEKLMVRTSYGEIIPVSSVTTTQTVSTIQSVTRENRQRAITLFANNKPEVSGEKALDDAIRICRETLPEGYSVEVTGASQSNRETFAGMNFILVLGFVVAYMILAAQFNSFLHPVTVLTAIPFTFTGAFLSLYVTHYSVNLYSGIGIILLMGIAKKNAILLVEFFNKLRYAHGKTLEEAVLEGGPTRLRPILMTSLATIAAAVPAVLGLGPGSEVRAPLASVVIGGVAVSTAFTLLVVPCVYSLFSRWESTRGREQSRRAYSEQEEKAVAV